MGRRCQSEEGADWSSDLGYGSDDGLVAAMASMASMVWMAQGGTDVEVLLVPMMVATNGGDGWLAWDGGLGSSTQRTLTWKSLCVTSSDGDTHSGSFAFRLNCLQNTSGFLSLCRVLDL